MEAIDNFAAAVETAFGAIATSVDGVVADVEGLKKAILDLQNNPPGWTADDQAKLDKVQGLAEGLATRLAALDAATETPPVPPAV